MPRGQRARGVAGGPWLAPLLALALGAHPALAQAPASTLPEIGDPASASLSRAQEQAVGKRLIREVRRSLPLVRDPQLREYVQSLGLQLAARSQDAEGRFYFELASDTGINAFALPGGIVVVNAGLVLAARNEAELAAVVAHEIAHVTQRHIARMYARSEELSVTTGLALLAAIVAAAYGGGEVGEAAIATTLAAGQQAQLNFSRANEQEADRVGIQTLAETGFEPTAMAGFFDRMQRLSFGRDTPGLEYLRTHPVTSSRIADSAARADQIEGEFRSDSSDFRYAQARLRALTAPPAQLIDAYERRSPSRADGPYARYGYALALIEAGRPRDAEPELRALIAQDPERLGLQLALAEALQAGGDTGASLALLEQLDRLYPVSESVLLPLGRQLLEVGRAEEAMQRLLPASRRSEASPDIHKTLSEIAEAAGERTTSHEALADYFLSLGDTRTAMQRIRMALEARDLDAVTRARLESKRDALEEALSER